MAEPFSILVYSGLDLIGDGLMKLPFLRALRHAYPHARITWMAGIGKTVFNASLAGLVAPYIDEIIENPGIGRDWRELWHNPLSERQFDLIVDTQRRLKTTLILKRIKHRRFISGTANFRLSSGHPGRPYAKKPRMIDNMLDLVAAANPTHFSLGERPIDGFSLDTAYTSLALEALPPGSCYAGLAPGAGGKHKQWPLDNFIALARALEIEGFVPVFLLGPDEAGWRQTIRKALPNTLLPLQETKGDPALIASPLFTIALAARLNVGIANDSGTGHMLAAADVPLVSLFGPTNPEKFAPYVTRGTVVRAQNFGSSDMNAIPVDAVRQAVAHLLNPG